KANLIGVFFGLLVIGSVLGYIYSEEISKLKYEIIVLSMELDCPNVNIKYYLEDDKITLREYDLFKRDCNNAEINKIKDKLR
ncbi:MAG: hypothetical protein ACTSQ9_06210, partial [Candidatus Hodarchaeales archaeon]